MANILANDGIDAVGKAMLEKAGHFVNTEKVPQEQLVAFLNDNKYSVLTVRSATKVRKELIDACPGLRIIARGGVGMDNIDVDYAKSKGINVINTPAASSLSVAELVFAHLSGMTRFLYDSNRRMALQGADQFDTLKKKYAGGIELYGKTMGIIGFGRIGQQVGRIALGYGMKVIASDPYVKEAEIALNIQGHEGLKVKIQTIPMESVFKEADMITLHVPGGKVITSKEFDLMKPGVMLVNAARGGVIDEFDLITALDNGKVAAIALDVFENEPKPSKGILEHPKVSLSPHIGAATLEAQERIGSELAEKIIEALK
jgi:D-3-phosphoglycerate dehydrogenase